MRNIYLIVHFLTDPAGIEKVTSGVVVDQNDKAVFECVADANPVEDDMIKWSRTGYDMDRVVQTYENGKSTMTISNVTKIDSGVFVCTVNNGIGKPATANAEFIVKCKNSSSEINIGSIKVSKL